MLEEKLLTVREAAQLLNLSEKEVIDLTQSGKLFCYKVGGVYLRFRRQHIEEFKKQHLKDSQPTSSDWQEKIRDFFYFYDFYIFSFIIAVILLIFILKTQ